MVEESNLFIFPVDLHSIHVDAFNYLAASGGQSGGIEKNGHEINWWNWDKVHILLEFINQCEPGWFDGCAARKAGWLSSSRSIRKMIG